MKYNKLGNNGDVVFFLHGYGGNKNSLEKLAKSVCRNCECYLFDLYGFGNSPMPDKCYDIYDYAISIYLLCIEKGVRRLNIVAHSFGGRIALLLSSMFDLKVDKLVLIDSAGLRPHYNLKYYFKIWRYKIAKNLYGDKLNKQNYGSREYKNIDDKMRDSYVKVVNQHLDYLLPSVRADTLLLWGGADKDTPVYMAKKMKKHIKASYLKIYNGDHFVYLQKYSYVKKDIKKFL